MQLPFGKTKELESQVDTFLDTVVKAVLVLQEGVRAYLEGNREEFENRINAVSDLERCADEVRKETKTALYTHSLIPESRGDVLGLLENMDDVVNAAKGILLEFDVQSPDVPDEYADLFMDLTAKSIQAVDHVVGAARCFFQNPSQIKDYISKVDFYESEADRAGLTLKKRVFRQDLPLARKLHLRYFAERLESLSDMAEDVGERLMIATIKRSV